MKKIVEKAKIIVYSLEFKDDLLSEDLVSEINSLLPEIFRLYMDTAKKNQKISFCAKVLLNEIMEEEFGVKDALLEYQTETNGKPYFKNHKIHFNYSHSDNLLVLAFCATSPIGIDIQQHKKVSEGVVNRITTDDEKLFLNKSSLINADFFNIWCRKEAVVKCSGVGIKTGLKRFSVLENETILDEKKYFIKTLKINNNFSCAVASFEPIESCFLKSPLN